MEGIYYSVRCWGTGGNESSVLFLLSNYFFGIRGKKMVGEKRDHKRMEAASGLKGTTYLYT